MNFLLFAALMFVICVAVLVAVSLLTSAPAAEQLIGLTFQTAQAADSIGEPDPVMPWQLRLNWVFTLVLLLTMILLWVQFA